jgi:hypothetical protein
MEIIVIVVTQICAGARTSPLLLSYALFHLSNASVVAVSSYSIDVLLLFAYVCVKINPFFIVPLLQITTAGTSVFIVVKIFLFSVSTCYNISCI